MTEVDPILEYLCPACGNPYYSSCIGSYTIIDTERFSDGSSWHDFSFYTWLTRCPECKQFFSKKHLFHFPISRNVAFLLQLSEANGNSERRNKRRYGNFDFCLNDGECMLEFLEKAKEEGIYFPITVGEEERSQVYIALYRDLWWHYNYIGGLYEDKKYVDHCQKLIDMLLSHEMTEETRLIVAELYRNIGEFEESGRWLADVVPNEKTALYIDCIKKHNKIKNRKTERIYFE